MTNTAHHPPELLKYGGREYLVYEVADHAEHSPTSIGVRLERHGEPKYSVFCTGSFTLGELRRVHATPLEEADTDEEREMIRLFNSSPDFQNFVRGWIVYCYRRHKAGANVVRMRSET